MKHRFQGKVVFITGASAGIGAEVARQLAREGAHLALLARRKDKLDSIQAEIAATGAQVITFEADVNDRSTLDDAVAGTLERFGRIDIVLANAGFGITGPVFKLTVDDFRRQFETNFFGVLNTLYATLDALRQSQGQLGLMGSVAGMIGTPASSPYNASKFAIIGLGEAIYHDLAELGISVTLVNPGFVDSEIRLKNKDEQLSGKKDPIPAFLVLPTPNAASVIVNALHKRRPDVIVTFHGKVFAWCKRIFPRSTRWVIRRMSKGHLPAL